MARYLLFETSAQRNHSNMGDEFVVTTGTRASFSVRHISPGVVSAIAVLVASAFLSAPSAHAGAQNVSGIVACINNASPVGVWVEARGSKSGWATIDTPAKILGAGGSSKRTWKYTLNNGGDYQLHVGCGGTSKKWANSLRTPFVNGNRNFICNDVAPWSMAAFMRLAGPIFGRADLTQGVPYGKCNAV